MHLSRIANRSSVDGFLKYAITANGIAVVLIMALGYSVLTTQRLLDTLMIASVAGFYYLTTVMPNSSRSLRIFALLAPNLPTVHAAYLFWKLQQPNWLIGIMSIYPVIYLACAFVVVIWLAILSPRPEPNEM